MTTSYNNEKVVTGEVEYPATDPASGAFFQPDFKKNEDLKLMLDGSKDSLKLEAMKRIIGMIAKGRDASDLFPAVVKNVVSKNIEVKKLVYVYLVRYAEEQQDLALLSISTFQRALKDPNQLIRASALRVLSSIRVPMIVPIVMLAIRDSASDMSPYVRKTAAHAIPKLYSLDPEQREELVAIIDKLLSDKAPLVVGSAAMAFSEVCGDRIDLIHKSYRKLCSLLADVDEWGQLALLNVLTLYARSCFPDPNLESYSSDSEKPFYESDSSGGGGRRASPVEADLRLLLRAARPLLQSRNAGVVMAVAQLFYHCGPVQELGPVAKALVRLLRAPLEVQSVVLTAIVALTHARPSLFEPYLKSFFVRTCDALHVKLLKLEVLTALATAGSAALVLRELHTYVAGADRALVPAAVRAVGRLALAAPNDTDACLAKLLKLLSSRDEAVVCEAVMVIKRVVGGGGGSARAAVSRAAKLLRADRLAGGARAAAVWLVAEHGAEHPRAAAVLAHMAGCFADQEEAVKLQVLSLAVKLAARRADVVPVARHVLALARYDASYDVRDRARLLRRLLPGAALAARAHLVLARPKPAALAHAARTDLTLGSLSQYLGSACAGYRPLPPHPAVPLAADRRDPPPAQTDTPRRPHNDQKNKSFYSEPESGSGSSGTSGTSSEESSSEEEDEETKPNEKPKETNNYKSSESGTSESDSVSSGSSGSGSESASTSDSEGSEKEEEDKPPSIPPRPAAPAPPGKSNLELLLELDEAAGALPTLTPTAGGLFSPLAPAAAPPPSSDITPVGPSFVPSRSIELVGRLSAGGLAASGRWARAPHLAGAALCTLAVTLHNHTRDEIRDVRVVEKSVSGARTLHGWEAVALAPGASADVTLGIDFADSIQPVTFTIASSLGEARATLRPAVGELMRAVTTSPARFDTEQKRLRGMTECEKSIPGGDAATAQARVLDAANLAPLPVDPDDPDTLRFAGRLLSSGELVLVSVRGAVGGGRTLRANCSNPAVAALLANELAQALQ
ncbi:AP-3 complex subunit beta-2 [Aricia agestis]|uniref:AP-3 complex subunit beta-2 n=1 Tax=Aricia agestis TaxID=91739 RepID=UPI001C202BE6|nr:AP-3 complex subunit beta-2 [Aricia agestis]